MSKAEKIASKLDSFVALDGGDIADVEQAAKQIRTLYKALMDLYQVAEVRRDEDYFAVTNAADALK